MARSGCWTKTDRGTVAHVCGANPPTPEGLAAIHAVIDAAIAIPMPPPAWKIEYWYSDRWYMLASFPTEAIARMQFTELNGDNNIRLVNPEGAIADE